MDRRIATLVAFFVSLAAYANPTIEIRRPNNPNIPEQIQYWTTLPAAEVWVFEISTDLKTWTRATNTTCFPDGVCYYETSTTARNAEFVRLRRL